MTHGRTILSAVAAASLLTLVLRAESSTARPRAVASVSHWGFAVKGMYLGAPEQLVRATLGRPKSEDSRQDEPGCEMGFGPPYGKTWRYEGLTVHLCSTTDDLRFHAFKWVVTSKRWRASRGIGVGSPIAEVVERLGQHTPAQTDENGLTVVHYGLRDAEGYAWLRLRNGIVVEIGIAEDWS